jgi:hypothetical protein
MQLDSVGWGQEDGEAELPGLSGKQGAARNGDEERRPWRARSGARAEEEERVRAGKREGREREARRQGLLILSKGSAASILADDGEAVASGGDGADTELLLLLDEDDEEVGWAGPLCVARRRRIREKKRPERAQERKREGNYFPFIYFSCFQNPLQCFELCLEQTCFGTFKIWDGLISTYYKFHELLF